MIVEEDAPTSVGQAHDGALADLRIMRRPENVNAEILNTYYYTCMTQQEQKSETKKERKGV